VGGGGVGGGGEGLGADLGGEEFNVWHFCEMALRRIIGRCKNEGGGKEVEVLSISTREVCVTQNAWQPDGSSEWCLSSWL